MQQRTWQIDLKLNRIATCVLLSGEPHFLEAAFADFRRSPFFTQPDLATQPFILTDWLHMRLANPRYGRLRGLSSFQREQGYYTAAWEQIPYGHLFDGIPMLVMACLTAAFGALALALTSRDPINKTGLSYATGLIAVGVLISFWRTVSAHSSRRVFICQSIRFFSWGCCSSSHWSGTFWWKELESLKNAR